MKIRYWNVRGIANSPTRLALKRILLKHKPDLVLLSEPWMTYDVFPTTWLSRLGLKVFSFNHRPNLPPNLWCICSMDLNPSIINFDNQQVSFHIEVNQQLFSILAIYASTNYITRRQLWQTVSHLQSQHNTP